MVKLNKGFYTNWRMSGIGLNVLAILETSGDTQRLLVEWYRRDDSGRWVSLDIEQEMVVTSEASEEWMKVKL